MEQMVCGVRQPKETTLGQRNNSIQVGHCRALEIILSGQVLRYKKNQPEHAGKSKEQKDCLEENGALGKIRRT
jgi:hypothetical protein